MLQQYTLRRAITLIELMLVIGIIVLLMMIAVPVSLFFTRSHQSVKVADEVSAAILQAQSTAMVMRTYRGIVLKRSNASLPASWYDQVEEVMVQYQRLPEKPNPGWAQYPGLVNTTAGRTVYHSRVVSFYRFAGGNWQTPDSLGSKTPPLYDKPLTPLQGPEQPLFLLFSSQGQSRQIVQLPPPGAPSTSGMAGNQPTSPPPNETQDWVWDPNNPAAGWQTTLPNEQPILQAHQVLISRSCSQLHLQTPNPPANTVVTNYQVYSLCPMPTNLITGQNAQFRQLKQPGVIDLTRSIPNQYPTPAAYYPSGTPTLVFGEDRSLVLPGNIFLSNNTLNGWIVLWVGLYRLNASGTPVILPEDSVLVGIHARTGQVRTFQVNLDRTLGDYYHYVRIARTK